MKLSDLKDLKVIKKDLPTGETPGSAPAPKGNQPRNRTRILLSKEEERARNEGLEKGQRIRMMDTNDTGTLVGFGKGYYEIALHGDLTVDLHIERIPGADGVPEWAALDYQLQYFRQVLRQNLKHKGRRISFVHGVGDGILAAALRKELDEAFAVSCTYTYSTPGVTHVTIR